MGFHLPICHLISMFKVYVSFIAEIHNFRRSSTWRRQRCGRTKRSFGTYLRVSTSRYQSESPLLSAVGSLSSFITKQFIFPTLAVTGANTTSKLSVKIWSTKTIRSKWSIKKWYQLGNATFLVFLFVLVPSK